MRQTVLMADIRWQNIQFIRVRTHLLALGQVEPARLRRCPARGTLVIFEGLSVLLLQLDIVNSARDMGIKV